MCIGEIPAPPKELVYMGQCQECVTSNVGGPDPAIYIGETSRQVGERIEEHLEGVNTLTRNPSLCPIGWNITA